MILALSAVPANAAFLDGNEFLDRCESTTDYDDGVCDGFVAGVVAMGLGVVENRTFALGQRLRSACVPPGVKFEQLRDVAVQYLQDNPEKRHFAAAASVWVAVAEAFPCD